MNEFHYKCPNEDNCKAKKHCHVLKTADELKTVVSAWIKCPVVKKEILVDIGPKIK